MPTDPLALGVKASVGARCRLEYQDQQNRCDWVEINSRCLVRGWSVAVLIQRRPRAERANTAAASCITGSSQFCLVKLMPDRVLLIVWQLNIAQQPFDEVSIPYPWNTSSRGMRMRQVSTLLKDCHIIAHGCTGYVSPAASNNALELTATRCYVSMND